jgi:hypothetical protein
MERGLQQLRAIAYQPVRKPNVMFTDHLSARRCVCYDLTNATELFSIPFNSDGTVPTKEQKRDALRQFRSNNMSLFPAGVPTSPAELAADRERTSRELIASGNQFYIIWCPSSQRPPQVAYPTPEAAHEVAAKLAVKYVDTVYFVLQCQGRVEARTPVAHTTLTPVSATGRPRKPRAKKVVTEVKTRRKRATK